ncbi:flagellar hook-associated protein FlgK [Pseudomonas abieticivorans]|uniref:flagellar hook-associated protein FlgK n=1 Tax=Pseudomonas abieticivorans TaxID=2931382 RepID=UPI002076B412|nr:flagellar hook-associated protein FlgK [Pseudomonas sp. PIA16]
MSIISIGVSGLNAAQVALTTSSNNITNVYTDGYNLETAKLAASTSGGVEVTTVDRTFDQFIATQLNASTSTESALSTYSTEVSQIDDLLSDSTSDLDTLMQDFFSSLQTLTSDAGDSATREEVIGSAETLTSQFNLLGSYLDDMQSSVSDQIGDSVDQVNDLTSQIASLNKQISNLGSVSDSAANTLLDQRDALVTSLSALVDVDVTEEDNGSYSVSLSNGLSLVSGSKSSELVATASSSDPEQTTVSYVDAAGNVTSLADLTITGGTLGGLLSFQNDTLSTAQNALGQMAVALAVSFNALQESGVDLNGDTGTAFFSVADPVIYSDADNTGSASLSATFSDDISDLTTSNYTVSYSDSDGYSVTDASTGEAVDATYDATAGTLTFGGLSVSISGTAADGDSFLIKPLSNAASSLTTVIDDPSLIAAGTTSGESDNSVALLMLDLQNQDLVGGSSTLSEAYASLVNDIGSTTSSISTQLDSQTSVTEQLTTLQSSSSGVNLDEEAADLVRYQAYYQACAKIVEVGSTVLDTILGLDA